MRPRLLVFLLVFYAALMALLIPAPMAFAKREAATCSGGISHATVADVTVPSGAVCRISGSTVNGSVTVQRDAYFEAWDTKVTGTVRASGARTVFLHDGTSVAGSVLVTGSAQVFLYRTSVGGVAKVTGAVAPGYGHVQVCDTTAGGIEIKSSGPDVLVGDPEAACPGNRISKDLVVVDNDTASELDVSGNLVTGSLVVTNNRGKSPKQVLNNTVQGPVDLANNSAPFETSRDTVKP